VTFVLTLPALFEHEGESVVARFPDIDVASQGRTKEEAVRNLIEAAQLFIESCYERNVLDEMLKSCGFVPGHADQPLGRDYLSVPVELLANRNGASAHTS
jgi:predicted RNase H-like HicB family nuclease